MSRINVSQMNDNKNNSIVNTINNNVEKFVKKADNFFNQRSGLTRSVGSELNDYLVNSLVNFFSNMPLISNMVGLASVLVNTFLIIVISVQVFMEKVDLYVRKNGNSIVGKLLEISNKVVGMVPIHFLIIMSMISGALSSLTSKSVSLFFMMVNSTLLIISGTIGNCRKLLLISSGVISLIYSILSTGVLDTFIATPMLLLFNFTSIVSISLVLADYFVNPCDTRKLGKGDVSEYIKPSYK